ncbi:hypothetical protein AB0K92_31500, partial [Streptomyces sp. NPDC052687]
MTSATAVHSITSGSHPPRSAAAFDGRTPDSTARQTTTATAPPPAHPAADSSRRRQDRARPVTGDHHPGPGLLGGRDPLLGRRRAGQHQRG